MDLEWILGLDLTPRSHGAIRFVDWLCRHASPPMPKVLGVHVIDPRTIGSKLPGNAPMPGRAVELARASVEALVDADRLAGIEAIDGVEADETLTRLAAASASGLVIGRAGAVKGWSLVNLGRVARRLLRRVPGPLCVVPADLEAVAEGPVVLGLADDASGEAAAHFAAAFARKLARGVQAVHVAADPRVIPMSISEPISPPILDPNVLDELRGESMRRLEGWLRTAGLDDLLPPEVEIGDPGPTLAEHARERRAACIVCGSRRLGLVDRVLQSSVGTDLAAHAGCPVIVVPPDFMLRG